MAKFKIKDMGRGFDGLTVEGEWSEWLPDGMIEITKIVNDHVVFGDRNVSFPVPEGALFISEQHLDEINEETREYDHKNPFGHALRGYTLSNDLLTVVVTKYETALTVTVLGKSSPDSRRTMYSQNYFDREVIAGVESHLVEMFREGETDDLVFELRQWKSSEEEVNGS